MATPMKMDGKGFDTLHSGDYWPASRDPQGLDERTWTEDQVRAATHRFTVDEIAELAGVTADDVRAAVTP